MLSKRSVCVVWSLSEGQGTHGEECRGRLFAVYLCHLGCGLAFGMGHEAV